MTHNVVFAITLAFFPSTHFIQFGMLFVSAGHRSVCFAAPVIPFRRNGSVILFFSMPPLARAQVYYPARYIRFICTYVHWFSDASKRNERSLSAAQKVETIMNPKPVLCDIFIDALVRSFVRSFADPNRKEVNVRYTYVQWVVRPSARMYMYVYLKSSQGIYNSRMANRNERPALAHVFFS